MPCFLRIFKKFSPSYEVILSLLTFDFVQNFPDNLVPPSVDFFAFLWWLLLPRGRLRAALDRLFEAICLVLQLEQDPHPALNRFWIPFGTWYSSFFHALFLTLESVPLILDLFGSTHPSLFSLAWYGLPRSSQITSLIDLLRIQFRFLL